MQESRASSCPEQMQLQLLQQRQRSRRQTVLLHVHALAATCLLNVVACALTAARAHTAWLGRVAATTEDTH